MVSEKPNIVILMADQLTATALSSYGNKVSKTPNIDRLADEGVVFESAYCNSPLCAPSRAALMTGKLVSNNKVFDNAAEFATDKPTFAHYLRKQGYKTILSGKMHFCGPDQLHGFEERLTTDIYPADYGWTPDWDHPNERLDWYHNMTSVTDAGSCVRTNQLDFDDEVVFTTRQKLFDLARIPTARPFCLLMSLTHPHDPFAIPQKYLDRYDANEIDLPKVTLSPDQLDPHSQRIRRMCDMADEPFTDAQIRTARHAYYGSLAYVDDQFGTILNTLKETGLDENTIVIVISDHGEMLGERGLWYKMHFFEGALRVPLIVHAPERFTAHRVSASVSLVDLLPTLVELGQGAPLTTTLPRPIDGKSLLPHLQGQSGHDEVIAEYLAEGAIAPIVMLRRGDIKFIYSPVDPALLYDLKQDPHELHNLADAPEHHALVEELTSEVQARWCFNSLTQEVIESQRTRQFIHSALNSGAVKAWDHQPLQDASRKYIRNNQTLDEQEAFARFPRVTGL